MGVLGLTLIIVGIALIVLIVLLKEIALWIFIATMGIFAVVGTIKMTKLKTAILVAVVSGIIIGCAIIIRLL